MTSNCLRRVQKELNDIAKDPDSQIFAEPQNGSDLTHLRATFPGPRDTPYEGGTYIVDVQIPNDYPFKPPVMKFVTKLWHPNISSQTVYRSFLLLNYGIKELMFRVQGAICLDTLGSAWSPVLTIKAALLSLQSLLSTPEPKDPQDAEVASMLMNDPERFQRVAREWAIKYAGAPKITKWDQELKERPARSGKPKEKLTKEELARETALRYVPHPLHRVPASVSSSPRGALEVEKKIRGREEN